MSFANYVFQKLFHVEWEREMTVAEKFEKLHKDLVELHAENIRLQMLCKNIISVTNWYEKSKSDISFNEIKIRNRSNIEIWLDRNGLWDGIFAPKPIKVWPSYEKR